MRSERDLVLVELLVLRCRRREGEAARELVGMFEGPLVYFVRRLVGSEEEAWDVVQEVWMKVFRGLEGVREPRAFAGFLFATARNAAMEHLRKKKVREALVEAVDLPVEVGEEVEFTAEDAEAVHWGLARLSLAHREVLTLFFLRELSIEEIAGVVGAPVGTVKSRIFHAKRALREVLEKGKCDGE
jgi:RNA polymerase sigma-70 factor (ECF subfamily)